MKDEKGRMNMDIDEDFEIPTFLPPKETVDSDVVDLLPCRAQCPVCDAIEEIWMPPLSPLSLSGFERFRKELVGAPCLDCLRKAVAFCRVKGISLPDEAVLLDALWECDAEAITFMKTLIKKEAE